MRDGFMSAGLRDALFDQIIACEPHFGWGTTRRGQSAHRRALVLESSRLGALESELLDVLCAEMSAAADTFGVDGSVLESVQVLVTASPSGCYYRPHRDEHDTTVPGARKISAVAFLHDRPRAFTGGDLRVFSPRVDGSTPAAWADDEVTDVEPIDNRLVLFDPTTLHEVTEVDAPSREFRDLRFSIVAWAC